MSTMPIPCNVIRRATSGRQVAVQKNDGLGQYESSQIRIEAKEHLTDRLEDFPFYPRVDQLLRVCVWGNKSNLAAA